MTTYSLHDAEIIGEHLGNIVLNFNNHSLSDKIYICTATLFLSYIVCSVFISLLHV